MASSRASLAPTGNANGANNHNPVGARLARESVSPVIKNLNTETKTRTTISPINNFFKFQQLTFWHETRYSPSHQASPYKNNNPGDTP
jgi:hypothetical protein